MLAISVLVRRIKSFFKSPLYLPSSKTLFSTSNEKSLSEVNLKSIDTEWTPWLADQCYSIERASC